MKYRIQYKQSQQMHQAEVEASSPTEAIVKFQHLQPVFAGQSSVRAEITSVSADDFGQTWE